MIGSCEGNEKWAQWLIVAMMEFASEFRRNAPGRTLITPTRPLSPGAAIRWAAG